MDFTFLPSLLHPIPTMNNNIDSQISNSINNKSRLEIVIEALVKTSEFTDKIRKDYGEHINIIIVTFDDNANIYSTIKLNDDCSSFNLINEVNYIPINNFKNIIENKLQPGGKTNFYAVNQAYDYLNNCLNNNPSKKISYLMSDGEHTDGSNIRNRLFDRTDLNKKFNFSLGIGFKSQYDEELLTFYGNEFIEGNSSEIVHDSIIGDTFGCTTLLDEDVEINIYAKCDKIISNHKVISKISNININKSEFNNYNHKFHGESKNNICKIYGSGLEIQPLKEDLIFIFYVDISCSMNIAVEIDDDLINQNNKKTKQSYENHKVKKFKSNSFDKNIISSDIESFNKFTLSNINKFNTYDEIFFSLSSVCENEDVYAEIISKSGIHKFKILNGSLNESDLILAPLYFDILEDFNQIMTMKESLDLYLTEDIKSNIFDLGLKIGSPDFNLVAKRISLSVNPTRLEIYYLALVSHINKLITYCKKQSDRLLDQMAKTPMILQRSVSSALSRQFTSAGYSMDCTKSISILNNDNDDDKCTICYNNLKEVIYDCGHCLSCKKCTKMIFFNINEDQELQSEIKNNLNMFNDINIMTATLPRQDICNSENYQKRCPLCRSNIKNVKIINHTSNNNVFKCITENCTNKASYFTSECSHLTYCKYCWKKGKGKLICKCGKPITNYCKIF